MEILIMSLEQASSHEPTKDTYALRIFGRLSRILSRLHPLKESSFYRAIFEYDFDHIYPNTPDRKEYEILYDRGLAERLITDFIKNKDGCESLLVSCLYGRNRSPAIAAALNEIFNLGYDTNSLKEKHPRLNTHVYNTTIETARALGVLK